jgi:hypothetical protein
MGAAESKLAFRNNVFALSEKDRAFPDSFWDSFLELPDTAEDVFNLFSAKDIRLALEQKTNILTLLNKSIDYMISFSNVLEKPTVISVRKLLNSCRLLTRILPFIFENPAFQHELFWNHVSTKESKGSLLVHALLALLFYRGLTIAPGPNSDENVKYIIW